MTDLAHSSKIGLTGTWVGFCFVGKGAIEQFFTITCPCGVTKSYGLHDFPRVTTPHPCGNPDHYSVVYKEEN